MRIFSTRDIPPRAAAVVVALALLASMVTGRENPAPAEASASRSADPLPEPAVRAPDLPIDKLMARSADVRVGDLFASASPSPPPPASAPVAAISVPTPLAQPATPLTPPLPFNYVGRMVSSSRTVVYLLKGEEMLLVEAGQTLGEYRVEGISDIAVSFVYTPSATTQILKFPATE